MLSNKYIKNKTIKIWGATDDPADVQDTSTPDDLAVHTADVPAERSYRDKAS
jgi:hypothetical protein